MNKAELHEKGQVIDRVANTALERAKSLGADEVMVSTSISSERRLVVENKEFSLANTIDSQAIGILVHRDQKKGTSSVNVTDETIVGQAVNDAMALASFSVPDLFLNLAKKEIAPPAKPLEFLFDDRVAIMDLNALRPHMQELLAELVSDKRVALDRFEMSLRTSRQSLLNSHGVRQNESQTMIGWDFVGMAVDGEEVSGMSYDGSFSYGADGYMALAKAQIAEFKEKVIQSLRPSPCPSYTGVVIFGPRAFKSIFVSTILYHAAGRSVMDKRSKWGERVGSKVASEMITIRDRADRADLSGASSYDGDGIPTRPQTFLDKGVLTQINCDVYSGKRLNLPPRGLSGGPFGLTIEKGSMPLAKMTAARGEILYIDRFSGNTDSVTGDFSGVAKSSRLFRNGQYVHNTTETMIAGNVFELLNHIAGVESTSHIMSGSYECPAVLVDGVSVTGA